MSNYETAARDAGAKTTEAREQNLQDVISRTDSRARSVLGMAIEIKSKLFKSPIPPSDKARASQVGMIGDVDTIEAILQEAHDVLCVVSERLA